MEDKVPKDFRGLKVEQGSKELKERLVLKVLRVLKEDKDSKVLKELKDHKVLRVR